MYTSTPSVVIAANVRPGLIGSESTPPWPKIHGFSIKTTSWPASGEYTLQPTSPNAINIVRYFIDLPQAMVDHQSTTPQAGTPAAGGTTWDRRGTGSWWSGRGSNPRPSHCERDALPAELPPHARRAILASRSGRSNQVLTVHAGCGYDPSGAAGVRGPETRHAGYGRASTGVYAAGSGRAECVAEHAAAPRPADPVFLSRGLHSGVYARGLLDP